MMALDVLLERLPTALVDDPARKRLRLLADPLPDALSARIGLEARLGDDPTVDLLLLVTAERQLAVLAGADPAVALPPELAGQPSWQGAARLGRRARSLAAAGSALPPGIWLELDAAGDQPVGAPAVFTAATPDRARSSDAEPSGSPPVGGVVNEVLRTLAQAPPDPALVGQVDQIVHSGLDVRQVGCFTARPGAGIRLFCAAPTTDPTELIAALAFTGWRGPVAAVERWLDWCRRHGDATHLNLDVTPAGPLPTIGLELSLADAAQPHQDPRWGTLLDSLVASGLCRPAKRDALLTLGRGYEAMLMGRRRYRQGLHHLKITVRADGGAGVKAYFGAYEVAGGPR
ncbi:hypothetical protein [Pilimelia columellifera]|uniref:Uncharacterized protein n=1 Tax=Pilimelia columellifera subsp. columellifera TaxID=706583 RepID=A0ABN3NP24_9ACTN